MRVQPQKESQVLNSPRFNTLTAIIDFPANLLLLGLSATRKGVATGEKAESGVHYWHNSQPSSESATTNFPVKRQNNEWSRRSLVCRFWTGPLIQVSLCNFMPKIFARVRRGGYLGITAARPSFEERNYIIRLSLTFRVLSTIKAFLVHRFRLHSSNWLLPSIFSNELSILFGNQSSSITLTKTSRCEPKKKKYSEFE